MKPYVGCFSVMGMLLSSVEVRVNNFLAMMKKKCLLWLIVIPPNFRPGFDAGLPVRIAVRYRRLDCWSWRSSS